MKKKFPVTDNEKKEMIRLLKTLNTQQKRKIISAIHSIKKKPDS